MIMSAGTPFFMAAQNCICNELSQAGAETGSYQQLLLSKNAICKAKGYEMYARLLLADKKLDSAEAMLNNAFSILQNNSCPENNNLELYKMYANLYSNRADFNQQLVYELKIVPIMESLADTAGTAISYLNVSNIFNRTKQEAKGIIYCRKALPVINTLSPSGTKAMLLTRVAQRYYFYYEAYKDSKYLDTVSMYAHQAKKIINTVPTDRKIQFLVNTRLVTVAIEKKQYDTALYYINTNLALCNRNTDVAELAVNYSDKAEVYLNLSQFNEAKKWADSSLVFTLLTQSPPHIANVYHLQYRIAEASGDGEGALAAYKSEKQITDSISNTENVKAITELEQKYNQTKNEKTIGDLAKQKQLYLLLAVAGLFGLIAIAFFVRQQNLTHKKRILETEQRLNRARMNPHFFFNALATLQSLAVRENDGEAMASNLSKFSHIMRETLESTYKEYITVEQEMYFLNEYLDVQKIRFPKVFNYEVVADEDVETDEVLIPSMILQPFVENSIEHGFGNIDYTGEIRMHFSKAGKDLKIVITDNGSGLATAVKENNEHISRASQIIKDRIYLLNIKLKTKASFSIENNAVGRGVVVTIFLPLLYEQDLKP